MRPDWDRAFIHRGGALTFTPVVMPSEAGISKILKGSEFGKEGNAWGPAGLRSVLTHTQACFYF